MEMVREHLARAGAVAAISLLLLGMGAPTAQAAQATVVDARDLMVRLQRMERDLRDLQAETFRRSPGGPADFGPPPQSAAGPDLSPIMRRLDEFGDSISRLNGQMEELNHQIDQLAEKSDRLQKEMDYQAKQAAQAPPESFASTVPDRGPSESGVLGRLPAGRDTGAPPPGPGSRGEYETAMNLLSRGQTTPARERFRSFADAHPDDDRAPVALYWTGDIAFSTQKDYDAAAHDFAELLKKYPMSQRAPEGMLKLGLSLIQLSQVKEGCAALGALPAKYPNASAPIATRARNARRDNKCR